MAGGVLPQGTAGGGDGGHRDARLRVRLPAASSPSLAHFLDERIEPMCCPLAGTPRACPVEIDVMSSGHRHGGLETLSVLPVIVGSEPVTARVGWREQKNAHTSDQHFGGFHRKVGADR